MQVFLLIDTTKPGEIKVSLGGDRQLSLVSMQEHGSQALLGLIKKALKKGGIVMEDLDGIKVSTGPGSFTGIRVGVSVANALGFGLKIPVNGKQIETELVYG